MTLKEMTSKGGRARMASMSKAERAEFARKGAKARWKNRRPKK